MNRQHDRVQSSQPALSMAGLIDHVAHYPLLEALRGRRSRRFGRGMAIEQGPLTFKSQYPPLPLDEAEEAALAFAACGITGPALADLAYGAGQGGGMLAGLVGRTIASADAINTVALVTTNDEATYLIKRPQDLSAAQTGDLIRLAQQNELTELYRRSRVKIGEGRTVAPIEPGYNFNINRWSLYAPGGTYFLPLNEITALYINAMLEAFDPDMGLFVRDERASFRPAGIASFGRSKGGHLYDDPGANRTGTILALETSLIEAVAIEQGMMLQNLGLMTQALGLGGFPNFARHEFGWFEALGFRMGSMLGSRYLGANRLISLMLGLSGQDQLIPYPLGLERNGEVLLKSFCPPYYPSMTAAVEAYVTYKFGELGVFRAGSDRGGWREPASVGSGIARPSQAAIEATSAYCEYIYRRYGRFPAHSAPFRTVLGYQATHVDVEFYDRFYRPEALTATQREHLARWHGH